MKHPTTYIRRLLVVERQAEKARAALDAERALEEADRNLLAARAALREADIHILDREDRPFDVRVQYRHASRVHLAVYPKAMVDAEASSDSRPIFDTLDS